MASALMADTALNWRPLILLAISVCRAGPLRLTILGRRRAVVVPFAPNSPILMHLRGLKQPLMPYGRDALPENELKIIENWVLSGARGPHSQGGVTIYPPLEFEGK